LIVSPHFDPVPLQLSALQLAWMHELGIEKPWIPAPPPKQVLSSGATVARAGSAAQAATTEAAAHQPGHPQASTDSVRTADKASAASAAPVRPSPRPASQTSSRGAKGATTQVAPVTRGGAAETEKLAAAAQTLEALAEAIASCQACGLCLERERVVVGQGVMQAAVMVVGEGPGEQEDRQGEPFVGRSGMLLDNMLSTIDSGREKNVYLANIIKCRPPGNRSPRPEEVAACKPYLLRQIELVKPRTILALGKPAAQSLLGVEAHLALMREQAYTLPHPGHTVPVVVSYHPAYLLRKATEKAAAWKDLNQVRALIEG
jgi:uracil-DNA glycosylase family 4